jgi:mono/diheme cytochrome c family protein
MTRSSLLWLSAGLLGGLAAMASLFTGREVVRAPIVQPEMLSAGALQGERAYNESCVQCHGLRGAGTYRGPPLVHQIYEPGHHADRAFQLAVRGGVRQHHWRFGNMPPQPQVSDVELRRIINYIREVQRANGVGTGSRGS